MSEAEVLKSQLLKAQDENAYLRKENEKLKNEMKKYNKLFKLFNLFAQRAEKEGLK